jgi:putative Mn2+ efflux pump MntP
MTLSTIFLVALSMAMDAFAVSLCSGLKIGVGIRPALRLAFHFGLFQALLPVMGWFLGSAVASLISAYDHWVAFALLAVVGVRMVRSGLSKEEEKFTPDPSRGWTMVMLSVAVSIDALAIGLSLGLLGVTILVPALVIGAVTAALSLLGLRIGLHFGQRLGKTVEVLGGVLLIGIGLQIVIRHLTA